MFTFPINFLDVLYFVLFFPSITSSHSSAFRAFSYLVHLGISRSIIGGSLSSPSADTQKFLQDISKDRKRKEEARPGSEVMVSDICCGSLVEDIEIPCLGFSLRRVELTLSNVRSPAQTV